MSCYFLNKKRYSGLWSMVTKGDLIGVFQHIDMNSDIKSGCILYTGAYYSWKIMALKHTAAQKPAFALLNSAVHLSATATKWTIVPMPIWLWSARVRNVIDICSSTAGSLDVSKIVESSFSSLVRQILGKGKHYIGMSTQCTVYAHIFLCETSREYNEKILTRAPWPVKLEHSMYFCLWYFERIQQQKSLREKH